MFARSNSAPPITQHVPDEAVKDFKKKMYCQNYGSVYESVDTDDRTSTSPTPHGSM